MFLLYKYILLAADGSENAYRAAQEACKIAKISEETLIELVYVVDFDKAQQEMLHAGSAEKLELARRQQTAKIEQLLKAQNITYKITLLRGVPGSEIVKYANDKKVDLVVIGSRGLNSLQEMVLGSVSHKVMKRVNCPALIVK